MIQLDELHKRLCDALDDAKSWSQDLFAVPGFADWSVESASVIEVLSDLRRRGASTLINVALFGTFSSGKSFLASGLQGHLEVVEVLNLGLPAERFIGLLPSSPAPTTACPVQIVPVGEGTMFDTSGRGFVRVRLTDSPAWEDVGNSPAPAVIAAYVTDRADVSNRQPTHWRRDVAEVEILLKEYKLPAKLYDLPGYGSPIAAHEATIRRAMSEADCFVYVTRANRTLSDEDLELMSSLYAHCRSWRKRVIWVLTGIDEATNVDLGNERAWESILKRNNQYLSENFQEDGKPDVGFINDGFIPVSPAYEARGTRYRLAGDTKTAALYSAESRMDRLRQVLSELVERESGRKHIADIAATARTEISPLLRAVNRRLAEERLPVDQLADVLASQRERRRRVDEALPRLRGDLEELLESRVRRASRPFAQLSGVLHAALDGAIRETDVRKPSRANQIHVIRTQVLHDWIEAANGPADIWDEQVLKFQQDVAGWARARLGAGDPVEAVGGLTFDMEELDLTFERFPRTASEDLVQRAALIVGVAAPVAAAATWIGGALAAAAAFPPAGAIAGAAALVYMTVKAGRMKLSSLEVTQQEWIAGIDAHALAVKTEFELALASRLLRMVDALLSSVERQRANLDESIEHIQKRLTDPENQTRRDVVDTLSPLDARGAAVGESLGELASFGTPTSFV
jgi:hypothetical protein